MKIVKLNSENILRLNAVEITPDGEVVVIGGDNEQGKTSVLDSIVLALGGKQATATMPLKQGKDKGKVVCDLGDLVVTRTFTKNGGGTLKVSSKDGAVYPSPQTMLDKLSGQLTFDPLAWSKMEDRKQLEVIKKMVGLDFTEIEENRKKLYSQRTDTNRDIKRMQDIISDLVEYPEAPTQEVSVADLMKTLSERQAANSEKAKALNALNTSKQEIDRIKEVISGIESDIEAAKKDLVEKERTLGGLINKKEEQTRIVKNMKEENESEIKDQISAAGETNKKIQANIKISNAKKALGLQQKDADSLTDKINDIDNEKAKKLATAKFPIEKMSFDETGVLYKEIPFAQASSAEKLRVSVAMGIVMNPELKVLLIRDGSLLDSKNLQTIADMAKESGHQIWIERVGKGKECSVIIEDGMVAQ